MTSTKFTSQQILSGLPEIWSHLSGTDVVTLRAETRLYDFMMNDGTYRDIDFHDVKFRLQHHFQFECSREEWLDFLGMNQPTQSMETWLREVSPRLTFFALAEFIAKRTEGISFSEIEIATSVCAPAGAFIGISESFKRTATVNHFAPSDRIIDVVSGANLLSCWTHLRWQTQNTIPDLPDWFKNLHSNSGCLATLILLAGLGLSIMQHSRFAILVSGLLVIILYGVIGTTSRLMNPLPDHLQTFRQLAKHIAAEKQEGCDHLPTYGASC